MANTSKAPHEALYEVFRGDERSPLPVTEAEVRDFLDACGLPEDSPAHELVLAGGTLHIDGADMRFRPIEPRPARGFWSSLRQKTAALFRTS